MRRSLFEPKTKFNSGTGWPSFSASTSSVAEAPDNSLGMQRTEVLCNKCGGHLAMYLVTAPLKLDNVIASIPHGTDFVPKKKKRNQRKVLNDSEQKSICVDGNYFFHGLRCVIGSSVFIFRSSYSVACS